MVENFLPTEILLKIFQHLPLTLSRNICKDTACEFSKNTYIADPCVCGSSSDFVVRPQKEFKNGKKKYNVLRLMDSGRCHGDLPPRYYEHISCFHSFPIFRNFFAWQKIYKFSHHTTAWGLWSETYPPPSMQKWGVVRMDQMEKQGRKKVVCVQHLPTHLPPHVVVRKTDYLLMEHLKHIYNKGKVMWSGSDHARWWLHSCENEHQWKWERSMD